MSASGVCANIRESCFRRAKAKEERGSDRNGAPMAARQGGHRTLSFYGRGEEIKESNYIAGEPGSIVCLHNVCLHDHMHASKLLA